MYIKFDKRTRGTLLYYSTVIKNINMNLIVTSQEDLALIVKNAVNEALSILAPKKEEKKVKLTLDEALVFLCENGFKISKSQLYKNTMANKVPCMRFGRKIVFDCQELQVWAESKLKEKPGMSLTVAVAKSAEKKMNRV